MYMRYKKIDGEVYCKNFESQSDWGTDNPNPLLKGKPDGYEIKECNFEEKKVAKKKKKAK